MKISFLSLAAVFVFYVQVKAQSPTQSSEAEERMKQVTENLLPNVVAKDAAPMSIQERMEYYKIHNVSIAVVHNYKLDWAVAYNRAGDTVAQRLGVHSLFQAGSVSKSLNAVGVLKLMQEGKIDLNADINQYLTSWKFPYDEKSKGKKIVVANLLSHTAGLNLHGFPGYEKGKSLPTIIQILNGEAPANTPAVRSMFEPGLRYQYSGGGITISQLMVMDITHQAYDKYMNAILRSLGMTFSSYTQPPVERINTFDGFGGMSGPRRHKRPATPVSLFATGYNSEGKVIPGRYHIYPEQAAAGLWTNPSDLAQFIIEIQRSLKGQSNKVLDQKTTQLMLTPYIDKSAALGFFIDDREGVKYFQHGGADEGFRTQYYGSLEGGNGVVVMVNSDNGDIIDEIVNSVARVYQFKGLNRSKQTIAVSGVVLQQYTGKYQVAPKMELTVSFEDGRLYGQMGSQQKIEMLPETQSKFILKTAPVETEFIKDGTGKVTKMVIYEGGAHEAKKIE